ncbi:hypothetical protein M9H77_02632 [Catharanthus roseus]|uniref:Uncharacterized protein n=1 Tax=Catharanthus roseus TaxID=4058 RepID=A0ACC0C9C2_CATRO|nr:hypothetical protein M9H77_02632 [Catharanthus roseus]
MQGGMEIMEEDMGVEDIEDKYGEEHTIDHKLGVELESSKEDLLSCENSRVAEKSSEEGMLALAATPEGLRTFCDEAKKGFIARSHYWGSRNEEEEVYKLQNAKKKKERQFWAKSSGEINSKSLPRVSGTRI